MGCIGVLLLVAGSLAVGPPPPPPGFTTGTLPNNVPVCISKP